MWCDFLFFVSDWSIIIIGPGGLLLVPSGVLVFNFLMMVSGCRASLSRVLNCHRHYFSNGSQQAEKWRHPTKETVCCSFDAVFFSKKKWILDRIFRFQKSVSHLFAVPILGPLYTKTQGRKSLGPTLSIFGLLFELWPQATNKCWNIGPKGCKLARILFSALGANTRP